MPTNRCCWFHHCNVHYCSWFCIDWHIWWLVVVSFVASVVSLIISSFTKNVDYYVPAAEVERIEKRTTMRYLKTRRRTKEMAEVLHHDNHGHDGHHEHDDTDLTVFGFWTYLMSDLILFGSLFIAFAVLNSHIPPGTPSAKKIFSAFFRFCFN